MSRVLKKMEVLCQLLFSSFLRCLFGNLPLFIRVEVKRMMNPHHGIPSASPVKSPFFSWSRCSYSWPGILGHVLVGEETGGFNPCRSLKNIGMSREFVIFFFKLFNVKYPSWKVSFFGTKKASNLENQR